MKFKFGIILNSSASQMRKNYDKSNIGCSDTMFVGTIFVAYNSCEIDRLQNNICKFQLFFKK